MLSVGGLIEVIEAIGIPQGLLLDIVIACSEATIERRHPLIEEGRGIGLTGTREDIHRAPYEELALRCHLPREVDPRSVGIPLVCVDGL